MSADVQQAPSTSGLSGDKSDPTRSGAKDLSVHRRPSFHLIHKRHKEDIKQSRKRSQRFCYHEKHGGGSGGAGGPQVKRRKKEPYLIPPTKFLLGGNIRDPLNLNSLRDEEVNRRLNAVTPETSPMPTPQWKKGEVEVLLPPNIHDPLNLESCSQSPTLPPPSGTLPPSLRRHKKKHKRKNKRLSADNNTNSEDGCGGQRGDGGMNTSGSDCGGDETMPAAPSSPTQSSVEPHATASSCRSLETRDSMSSTGSSSIEQQDSGVEASGSGIEAAPGNVDPSIDPDDQEDDLSDPPSSPLPPPESLPPPPPPPPHPQLHLQLPKQLQDLSNSAKKGKGCGKKVVDKIVSPVVRQPGACGVGGPRRKPNHQTTKSNLLHTRPNFKETNKRYQYGNYTRYYGYRNAEYESDPRLRLLETRRDLFENKHVLDIGCNTGHITLAIAADLAPTRVVGLDVDRKLIEAARGNVKHYAKRGNTGSCYPVSMPLIYGPLPDPRAPGQPTFPHNVSFIQGNYVVGSDVLVDLEREEFDTILCLSVTKWIQLNWGDEGLKRAFRRMYAQLRPGGVLILEPQPWSSYKRKKNITETTWKNYQSIELLPQKFTQFLLSEVGFTKCELLGAPVHNSRGFERPIKIYTKGPRRRKEDSVGEDRLGTGQSSVEQLDTLETTTTGEKDVSDDLGTGLTSAESLDTLKTESTTKEEPAIEASPPVETTLPSHPARADHSVTLPSADKKDGG